MLGTIIRLELRKLRGTLAPLLTGLAPALVAVVASLIAARQGDRGWTGLVVNCVALWAYFILPVTVAALAALLAQIEHGPRMWDHLFALPVSRPLLLGAKLITLLMLVGAASGLLILFCFLSGLGLTALDRAQLAATHFPWDAALTMAASTFAAAFLMTVIQLWVAIINRSFVAPIALGLAGTFVLVASMGAPQAIVLPWAMPLATLPVSGGQQGLALACGFFGGLILVPAMAIHLARREF